MPLYGVTHDIETGEALTKLAKVLKIGIGYPRGPAIHAYISRDGKWTVEWWSFPRGEKPKRGVQTFDTRKEAEGFYRTERPKTSEAPYPRRLPYFTFLRIGPEGDFVHDFEAIEQAGPLPVEVPIVFVNNDPLAQAFEMWTAAELKCHGDGRDAERRIAMATAEQKHVADKCAAEGRAFFPILGGCHAFGCPYSRPDSHDKTACKPHSRLSFQLRNTIRLGGTCCYDTTGFRSAAWMFSSLQAFRQITGRGDPDKGTVAGLPIVMKVQPYRTSHAGKPSVQHGVSLEMKAKDVLVLIADMQATSDQYRSMIGAAARQLGAPSVEAAPVNQLETFINEKAEAKTMEAEYYPEGSYESGYGDDAAPEPEQEKPRVRSKSEAEADATDALIVASKKAAALGLDAYREYFEALTPVQRKMLNGAHEQNKEIAKQADFDKGTATKGAQPENAVPLAAASGQDAPLAPAGGNQPAAETAQPKAMDAAERAERELEELRRQNHAASTEKPAAQAATDAIPTYTRDNIPVDNLKAGQECYLEGKLPSGDPPRSAKKQRNIGALGFE